jgi:hypothetical protein
VQVDPNKNKQEIGKAAASGALKGAGQGAAIGSFIPGVGTAVGASVGALVGAAAGFIKGKKKARTYDEEVGTENIDSAQNASMQLSGRKEGGPIVGPGTAKSDSIKADIKPGSFIIPAENAKSAERLRKLYLKPTSKADLNQPGGVPVKVSNGEHEFSAEEVAILEGRGVNLDALAPNQEGGKYGLQKGGPVQSLKDGGGVGDLIAQIEAERKAYASQQLAKPKNETQKKWVDKANGDVYARNLELDQLIENYNSAYDDAGDDKSKQDQVNSQYLGQFKAVNDSLVVARRAAQVYSDSKSFTTDKSGQYVPTTEAVNKVAYGTPTSPANTEKSVDNPAGVFTQVGDKWVDQTGKEVVAPTTKKPVSGKPAMTTNSNAVERELTPQEKSAQEIFQNLHSGKPLAPLPSITASAKLPSATEPIAQIAQADADATFTADTGQQPPAPSSGVQKVFQSLGPAGGAAIIQGGLGVYFASKDKMPVDKVDPQLLEARNRAQQNATFGFTPELMAQQKARIESNRRGVVGNISQFSGGNVGMAVGNSRMATIDANQSNLALAAASQQSQQQKQGYADNLTSQVASANRRIFEDSRQNVMMNQQVGANLIGAGLSNLFGSMQYKDQQNRIDDRMNKYGRDPWANYATQPAI